MHKIIAFCKWCQDLPIPELAGTLKQLGLDGVDLPCRTGSPIDPTNAPSKLPEAKKVFEDHGLRIERLSTGLREADTEAERLLEVSRKIGIQKIRIAGYPLTGPNAGRDPRELLAEAQRGFASLGLILEKHGVAGAVQNHAGPTLDVNISSCLLMLSNCDPQWVGVQYDPGHACLSGEPIEVAVGLLGPYLHTVNVKSPRHEYSFDPASGRLRYAEVWGPLWDGMLDVPLLLDTLAAAGHTGSLSIHAEYRSHFHRLSSDMDAVNRLVAEDVRYLRALMDGTKDLASRIPYLRNSG